MNTSTDCNASLKEKVHDFWNAKSCGTQHTDLLKHTLGYYEEIEAYRYEVEPEIFSFAQFTRFHGKRVLEVGVGAGTDFLQWVRAGVEAYGVDLTAEGIENTRKRLEVYGLRAKDLRVADCEALPYPDNFFDLVYSWGVIHHTPDTPKAMGEIVRVTRPGGVCKIMVYNRHSLEALYVWIKNCAWKGRIFRTLSWVIYHHVESVGTKAFTRKEALRLLAKHPVGRVRISTSATYCDLLSGSGRLKHLAARMAASLLGWERVGWFMKIEFSKEMSPQL